MRPYYDDGNGIVIYHGDSRDVLPTIAKGSVDVVFTSPPYNQGAMSGGLANLAGGYESYGDNIAPDRYEHWQRETLTACWETLTERGAIFYNHSPIVRAGEVWLPTVLNPGLPLRQVIVWDQVVGINWTPTHFLPLHEWILLFAKPGFRLTDRSASHVGDVWRVRVEVPKTGRPDHPAAFPLRLPMNALSAIPRGRVLDPFMGSGTTLRAAKNLGWSGIGIETEERYCDLAARRLQQSVLPLAVAS